MRENGVSPLIQQLSLSDHLARFEDCAYEKLSPHTAAFLWLVSLSRVGCDHEREKLSQPMAIPALPSNVG
jgi:hypothetical protein